MIRIAMGRLVSLICFAICLIIIHFDDGGTPR